MSHEFIKTDLSSYEVSQISFLFRQAWQDCQTLTGETNQDNLLAKSLDIFIKYAQAKEGVFLQWKNSYWQILVSRKKVAESYTSHQVIREDAVPLTLINHVASHGIPVIANLQQGDDNFNRDPYFRNHQPSSYLCYPLFYSKKLLGIIYLEEFPFALEEEIAEIFPYLAEQTAWCLNLRQREQTMAQLAAENQQLKEELISAEKMANLGSLVADITHEINTPIGISVTAASLLAEEASQLLGVYRQRGTIKRSQLENFLETTQTSSTMLLANLKRISKLITSFKKVAIDQSQEEKRDFQVKEYLEDILLSLAVQLEKSQHQIEVDCPANIFLHSYPGAFYQIVTNLILNSLIHGYEVQEQGKISLKFFLEEKKLVFIYRDDGKGIEPENRERIFQPFFTTRKDKESTGIGLHIVHNLITKKLQGTVKCQSKLGKGTTFLIKIPQ